jgi:putative adenylate-forming enzyme
MIGAAARIAGHHLRRRFDHLDPDRLERHQQRQVTRLIRHLRRHSPYYHEHLDSDRLDAVPLMDKATMMRHFDAINTAGLHRDELVAFRVEQERAGRTDLFDGRYSVGLSSGTSGNKVLTVLSRGERIRYAALLWARSGIPREVREPRVLFALRTNNPAFTSVTMVGVELVYVDYFVPVDELVALINRHRLNVLAGPPSLLVLLAEQRERIVAPIEAVLSYAEVLDDPTRTRIGEAFGAPVSQIYQGAEGMLGVTCPAGNLHLNEDVVLVELHDAGDEIGGTRRVVVTDLYRRTQPFLRYQLNDLLEIDDAPCPCGSAFRRIARVHGRADSVLHLPGVRGGRVRLMPDYVRRSVNQASQDVVEYQVVQWASDDIEVRLMLKAGADREQITRTIRDNLAHWARRADGVLGTVRFTDTPPTRDEGSRKLIRVINQWN